jgi:hypothetical protein
VEMWNIHLVKRLAKREGSIANDGKLQMGFASSSQAYAIYPGAVGATKVGRYYCSH